MERRGPSQRNEMKMGGLTAWGLTAWGLTLDAVCWMFAHSWKPLQLGLQL